MKENNKKSLYESIMNEISKEVKIFLNENANSLQSQVEYINNELETFFNGGSIEYEALNDYLNDALSVEYTVDGNGDFISAQYAITLGGPSIYIDTRIGKINGYWSTEEYSLYIDDNINDAIQQIAMENYNSVR